MDLLTLLTELATRGAALSRRVDALSIKPKEAAQGLESPLRELKLDLLALVPQGGPYPAQNLLELLKSRPWRFLVRWTHMTRVYRPQAPLDFLRAAAAGFQTPLELWVQGPGGSFRASSWTTAYFRVKNALDGRSNPARFPEKAPVLTPPGGRR